MTAARACPPPVTPSSASSFLLSWPRIPPFATSRVTSSFWPGWTTLPTPIGSGTSQISPGIESVSGFPGLPSVWPARTAQSLGSVSKVGLGPPMGLDRGRAVIGPSRPLAFQRGHSLPYPSPISRFRRFSRLISWGDRTPSMIPAPTPGGAAGSCISGRRIIQVCRRAAAAPRLWRRGACPCRWSSPVPHWSWRGLDRRRCVERRRWELRRWSDAPRRSVARS